MTPHERFPNVNYDNAQYKNWKSTIQPLVDQGIAIDKIAKRVGMCRDIIRALHPEYKGRRGQRTNEQLNNKFGSAKDFTVKCAKCGKDFIVNVLRSKSFKTDKKYFCSVKCAHGRLLSYQYSDEVRQSKSKKLSIAVKRNWNLGVYKISDKPRFSSKGERELILMLQTLQPENHWTTGGLGYRGVQRDIFSKELKVAIEYDGIWHFCDIQNQLKKKLRKDTIYQQWCINNGWTLIRIDEELFKTDKLKYINKIIDIINSKKVGIYKFWADNSIWNLKASISDRWFKFLIAHTC